MMKATNQRSRMGRHSHTEDRVAAGDAVQNEEGQDCQHDEQPAAVGWVNESAVLLDGAAGGSGG